MRDAEAAVERLLRDLDDRDRDADVGEVHRDAAAHGAGADDRGRRLDLARSSCRPDVRDLGASRSAKKK